MKNSLKTLRVALASTALISVFAPNAQAEDLTFPFSGNIVNTTCTIGLYATNTSTALLTQITLPNVPLATINGALGTVAGSTAFFVGVPTGCATSGPGLTTFNTGFSAVNVTNGKVTPNTSSTASGVTIDLTSGTGTSFRSLTLTATPPASSTAATTQTGQTAVTLASRQAFAARYYKTAATGTNATAGTLTASIVLTGYYP